MVHRSTLRSTALCALAAVAAGCGGSGSTGNAAPRIDSIPLQATTGGSMFSLDLAAFTNDREGTTVTYAVTSGGGSFAGSVYSNTFPTMGTHTVEFAATDGSKTTPGSFQVRVDTADFVVVREDDTGLLLLDADTNALVRVAAACATPSLAAGLADGRCVYRTGSAQNRKLFVFDPMTRTTTQLATSATGPVEYQAHTSDGRIVYTAVISGTTALFVYNPRTNVARQISDGTSNTLTVVVDADDLVFYEIDDNGQADVWYYDPAQDDSYAVATGASDEQLQAPLTGGGVVLTRIGGGGETDLFAFTRASGLVEIGSDLSTTVQNQTKTYAGHNTADQVVFEVTAAASTDLYVWDLDTGSSRAIATGANDERFAGVTTAGAVVYRVVQSPTDDDLFLYDWTTNASATIRATASNEIYVGTLSNGDVVLRAVDSGDCSVDLFHYDVSAPALVTIGSAGADDYVFQAILANDHVVYVHDAATPELSVFDPAAGTSTPVASGGAVTYGGEAEGGDFVFVQTVAAQTDLNLWDESATAVVPISAVAGDEAFAAWTVADTLLFTRVTAGNTNEDLFVWDGATATQLTDADGGGIRHDHSVQGQFSGSRL